MEQRTSASQFKLQVFQNINYRWVVIASADLWGKRFEADTLRSAMDMFTDAAIALENARQSRRQA